LGRLDRADRAEIEPQGAARRAATLEAKLARVPKRRELHQAMLTELVASGESQLLFTDPDARGMAMHPKVGVGYNAQVAVDARYKLIVEQNVTNSSFQVMKTVCAARAGQTRCRTHLRRKKMIELANGGLPTNGRYRTVDFVV